jgi:hypothetical protein
LRGKYREADETFVVTWQDRTKLWEHHPDLNLEFPTWIWAAKRQEWRDFENNLVERTRKQGYLVEFVELMGAECLDRYLPLRSNETVAAAVVTDTGRRSERFCKENRQQLVGCSEWEPLGMHKEEGDNVWCCDLEEKPSFRLYLVLTGQKGELTTSSSDLGKTMKEKDGKEMTDNLNEMVLGPDSLMRKILNNEVKISKDLMTKLSGDSELQSLVSTRMASKEEL